MLRNGNLSDFDLRTHGAHHPDACPGRVAPYDTYISAAGGLGPRARRHHAAGRRSSPTPRRRRPGTPITSVHIPFTATNNTLWTWNAASGHWLLSYSGTPRHGRRRRPDRHDQHRRPDRARHLRAVAREQRGRARGAVADDRERAPHGAAQRRRHHRDVEAGRARRPHHPDRLGRIDHRAASPVRPGSRSCRPRCRSRPRARRRRRRSRHHRREPLGRERQRAGSPDGNPARELHTNEERQSVTAAGTPSSSMAPTVAPAGRTVPASCERMRSLISIISSGVSTRNCLAFSRPCPSCSPS